MKEAETKLKEAETKLKEAETKLDTARQKSRQAYDKKQANPSDTYLDLELKWANDEVTNAQELVNALTKRYTELLSATAPTTEKGIYLSFFFFATNQPNPIFFYKKNLDNLI